LGVGLTSNTSTPPQKQVDRIWNSGTPEPFTFKITKIPASLTASAATSGDFTIGGSNVKASYTDIASYEPNAIKIWARSTTTSSGVTINDLKIKTPCVPGETVFPGTVINVSQNLGPVFQEIIIAGVDFKSMPGGTVTLEGNVAMQFGNAPAPRGSSLQFHVIATHIPWVDLDVDSNNMNGIDDRNGRRTTDDPIEDRTDLPGVIVPVGGSRAKMTVDVQPGRTATLAFDADAAKKVRVYSPTGNIALDADRLSLVVHGPGAGHARSDEHALRSRPPLPFRGHGHRLAVVPLLSVPRVLPPHPLRPPRRRRRERPAARPPRLARHPRRRRLLPQRAGALRRRRVNGGPDRCATGGLLAGGDPLVQAHSPARRRCGCRHARLGA